VSNSESPPLFLTTRWSLVVSAAEDSEASLEALCRQYWFPAYAVARRAGNDVETAKDLTQAFFAKLLEKRWLATADPTKGRFRTFLITALKRFMVNEWHHEHAARRGGHQRTIPLDTAVAEGIYAREDRQALAPDTLFDRHWALALLDAALLRLEDEYGESGRHEEFAVLKPCLTAGRGETDYALLAHHATHADLRTRLAHLPTQCAGSRRSRR